MKGVQFSLCSLWLHLAFHFIFLQFHPSADWLRWPSLVYTFFRISRSYHDVFHFSVQFHVSQIYVNVIVILSPYDYCLLVILSVLFPLISICLRPQFVTTLFSYFILDITTPATTRNILGKFYKIRVLLGILGAMKTRTEVPSSVHPRRGYRALPSISSSLCPPRSTSGLHSLDNCECVGKGHRSDMGPWYVTWTTWGGLCFCFSHFFTTTGARVTTVLSASWCAVLIEGEALTS
jgi:hypothetical protein